MTLIDATSGRRFASTELPVDQLPETFELSTTMHIGADDWRVERADPIDRAGYVANGRLTLVLRKAEKIEPSKILFSLPTLEDALPPMREPDSSSAYEIHEDDWRQREFVSRQYTREIDAEMVEIRKVWAERDGPGFKRAHVRSHCTASPIAASGWRPPPTARAEGHGSRRGSRCPAAGLSSGGRTGRRVRRGRARVTWCEPGGRHSLLRGVLRTQLLDDQVLYPVLVNRWQVAGATLLVKGCPQAAVMISRVSLGAERAALGVVGALRCLICQTPWLVPCSAAPGQAG